MNTHNVIVTSNILFIKQGIELLSDISDDLYTKNNTTYSKSGIGRHFRHIIEHYFSFIQTDGTFIDYDARERNLRLETDRQFMIDRLGFVISGLQKFENESALLDKGISVRSNEGIGEENSPLSSSTLRRELQFLISHTVHHYALIGLILQTMGYIPDESFGVAPSTLKYELEQKTIGNG